MATPGSQIDVMIDLEEYNPLSEAEINELVFQLNRKHDCLISAILFGRKELEEGPFGESPIHTVVKKAGVRKCHHARGENSSTLFS
jgi:hypothetical protein